MIFDPTITSYEALLARARDRDCARPIFARDDRQEQVAKKTPGLRVVRSDAPIRDVEDDKYYLGRTPMRFLPMTRLQRTRINADVTAARLRLSPRQLAGLALVEKHPKAGWPLPAGRDLRADLAAFEAVAAKLREPPAQRD